MRHHLASVYRLGKDALGILFLALIVAVNVGGLGYLAYAIATGKIDDTERPEPGRPSLGLPRQADEDEELPVDGGDVSDLIDYGSRGR